MGMQHGLLVKHRSAVLSGSWQLFITFTVLPAHMPMVMVANAFPAFIPCDT
jgi:hypothetical protein